MGLAVNGTSKFDHNYFMEITTKKYQLIYADPPWHFRVWSERGKARSPDNHYPTRSLDYLRKLNIPGNAEINSVLLLWATFPCLRQAFELAASWGFTYKTVAFTWVKTNKNNGRPFMGMGYYTRANAELVLLFTRGKPLPRQSRNVPQVLLSPIARHSEKPDVIRDRIVELFGDVSRIELFARDRQDHTDAERFAGGDVFGNEAANSIILPGR
ncbi:MT-A70 family methyltransferase [Mucilaginibacter lutimaris]|uniref:MT-A70 family methyltransferase n=2 Tax=Mucilaginibacter lutimaris TaxID=931629 RepID=A0ABW2ZEC7_9SPHI